ncbi:hypothetical protein FACS1894182_01670 [Bacteroidia bacterium]|nr:hypothetical protein FACS1894182_01670 [Bacteroidia bacterium]
MLKNHRSFGFIADLNSRITIFCAKIYKNVESPSVQIKSGVFYTKKVFRHNTEI